MSRTPAATLRETVATELITYLGAGTLNTAQLAQSIDYRDQNIASLDDLKRLRFVLHDPVIEYLEQVPEWLRRIKTDHREEAQHVRGEIRGRIDWPKTTQLRSQTGFTDPTQFVITSPTVQYDLPENRVVKKLLSDIVSTISQEIAGSEYSWSQWDEPAIDRLTTTVSENRYLNELPDAAAIELSSRELNAASQSRHELYRRGEELYRTLDDLLNDRYGHPGVQQVLKETVIAPAKTHKLFELFCLFAFVRQLTERHPGTELHPIQSDIGPFAVMESEAKRIEVHYDQTGALTFREPFDRLGPVDELPETIQRQINAVADYAELADAFLGRGNRETFYEGRPDLVVLEYSVDGGDDRLEKVVIGEFKYTRSEETFSQGLRELLEYMHFARQESEYLIEATRQQESPSVHGLLCTDGVETNEQVVQAVTHHTTETLTEILDGMAGTPVMPSLK